MEHWRKEPSNKAERLSEALCYLPVDGSRGNHVGVESGLSGPALPELGPNRAAHLAAVPHVAKLAHRACNKKYEVRIKGWVSVLHFKN